MKNVILYGFDKLRRPTGYRYFRDKNITIRGMLEYAEWMCDHYGNTSSVYAIDDYYGLRDEYWNACKGGMEVWIQFWDQLDREGILLAKRK